MTLGDPELVNHFASDQNLVPAQEHKHHTSESASSCSSREPQSVSSFAYVSCICSTFVLLFLLW